MSIQSGVPASAESPAQTSGGAAPTGWSCAPEAFAALLKAQDSPRGRERTGRHERDAESDGPADLTVLAVQELRTSGPARAPVAAAIEAQGSPSPGVQGGGRGGERGQGKPMGQPQAAAAGEPTTAPAKSGAMYGANSPPSSRAAATPTGSGPAAPAKGRQQPEAKQAGKPGVAGTSGAAGVSTRGASAAAIGRMPGSAGVRPASAPSGPAPVVRPLAETGTTRESIASAKGARGGAAPRAAAHEVEPARVQFARGLAAALRQGGGSVVMKLSPGTLGEVRVRLDLEGGRVLADFRVGSEEARRLLMDSLGSLRTALEARGLEVQGLSVQIAERNGAQDAQEQPELVWGGAPDSRGDGGGGAAGHRGARQRPTAFQGTGQAGMPPGLLISPAASWATPEVVLDLRRGLDAVA
jgi:flagellar hook-length control protein FliK